MLHVLRRSQTTSHRTVDHDLDEEHDRVAMHGVRTSVLRAQANVPIFRWFGPAPDPARTRFTKSRIAPVVREAAQRLHAVTFGVSVPRGRAALPGVSAGAPVSNDRFRSGGVRQTRSPGNDLQRPRGLAHVHRPARAAKEFLGRRYDSALLESSRQNGSCGERDECLGPPSPVRCFPTGSTSISERSSSAVTSCLRIWRRRDPCSNLPKVEQGGSLRTSRLSASTRL